MRCSSWGALLRSAGGILLALSLLPLSVHAAVKPSLRTVSVPSFTIGTLGKGWLSTKLVVVTVHAGPWVVGVEVRPQRGSFKVAVRQIDLCGGTWFQAIDTAGHTKTARGPALACPSPAQPTRPILSVVQGKRVSATQYRLLAPSPASAVKMHVGDTLYLWEGGTTVPTFTPTVDPAYLALLAQGKTPARMCTQVICAEGFEWTWVAVRAGDTMIGLSPACRLSRPPCGMPDYALKVHIDP